MATTKLAVSRSAAAVLASAVLLLAACSDDADTDAAGSTTPTTAATDLAADGLEASAFCDEAPDLSAEVPESYVGSAEHVDDFRRLREVAPAALGDDLDLIIRHFDEAVDPADPDSQLMENFPDEVNEATGRVMAFIDENCATSPEPG